MERLNQFIVFTLDEQKFGVPLASVERVIRAAAVTPLPDAPRVVAGVVNMQGRIIPVIDVSSLFGLPEKDLDPGQQFIISSVSTGAVALVADWVDGVAGLPENDVAAAGEILPRAGCVKGLAKSEDGIILIFDPESIISPGELKKTHGEDRR
ncbi:MAG: chemotaxis protein CheW [Bacillota bacterium]